MWQPIESAPRDGARISVLIPYDPEIYTESQRTDEGWWDPDDECFRFTGDDGPDDLQPTHWQPLPIDRP